MLDNYEIKTFEDDITPKEYINLMKERTDEQGTLLIPGWYYDNNDQSSLTYKCKMDWNYYDHEAVVKEYDKLYKCIRRISYVYDEISKDDVANKKLFDSEDVFNVWNTYIRDFEIRDIDMAKIYDIEEKLETVAEIKEISGNIAQGKEVSESEKEFLKSYMDITVTRKEKMYYEKYLKAIYSEAEQRVGNNICAFDLVMRARRLCRLMSLDAPNAVLRIEARTLAAALVLHKFCKSKELVTNTVRHEIDCREMMTDDEFDKAEKTTKRNSRKDMVPLFVYLILKEYSNSAKHLKQEEILQLLREKYEVDIKRNTLSRTMAGLADEGLSIYSTRRNGAWMEQSIE